MNGSIRVRDLVERRQRQQSQELAPVDDRTARMAENARRHLAEHNDVESWLNPQKVRDFLTKYHDATPVEVQDTLDLLSTATHFTREDFENGSAVTTALATIRGEL